VYLFIKYFSASSWVAKDILSEDISFLRISSHFKNIFFSIIN